jgi:hypothetical protein
MRFEKRTLLKLEPHFKAYNTSKNISERYAAAMVNNYGKANIFLTVYDSLVHVKRRLKNRNTLTSGLNWLTSTP